MTDRIIVATFNDTNAAYDAASAIRGLKDAGVANFKLKTGVMIKKDDRGNVVLLESKDRHLLGTAVGVRTQPTLPDWTIGPDLSLTVRNRPKFHVKKQWPPGRIKSLQEGLDRSWDGHPISSDVGVICVKRGYKS